MPDAPGPELIVDDVLLLLFDPRNGVITGEGQALMHTLAGAVFVDLARASSIAVEPRTTWRLPKVRAVPGSRPAPEVLASAWDRIEGKPADIQSLVLQIGPLLRGPVLERLAQRGHLRLERRRMLGLIPVTSLVDGGTSRRSGLVASVRAALVDGADPDDRTAALAALLSASGSLPALHADYPWSGAVQARGKELERSSFGAEATGEAVRRTIAALNTTNLFVTTYIATR